MSNYRNIIQIKKPRSAGLFSAFCILNSASHHPAHRNTHSSAGLSHFGVVHHVDAGV